MQYLGLFLAPKQGSGLNKTICFGCKKSDKLKHKGYSNDYTNT